MVRMMVKERSRTLIINQDTPPSLNGFLPITAVLHFRVGVDVRLTAQYQLSSAAAKIHPKNLS